MTLTSAQTAAAMEVINTILNATGGAKGKRQLAGMFLELVDRTDWPQYYEIIPEPRCLNNIKASVEKGRYKDALDIYTDLSLVFWNALFYNEPDSVIALDAGTLKTMLEVEWKKKSVLPSTRTSPPPSAPQKVHKTYEGDASTSTPIPPAPVPAHPVAPAVPLTQVNSTMNSNGSNHVYGKPVPIRPRSAQPSPDVDVDIVSLEPDDDIERDEETEEIVKQLEKGLPRWPGFGEEGWAENISQERIIEIIHALKSYKDVIGNRLAAVLEAVPEEGTTPYLSYTSPISLKLIENHARSNIYSNSKEFDIAISRLFEKARRWYKPGTEPYGRVLLLQRFYQALTSHTPPPGSPYHTTTNFASLRAGPGNTKPVHGSDGEGVAGVTTHRVLTKDRTFVDEVHYKGWTVKLADWLHLSNPDDPSRPIIAQVFRCWISDEISKKGHPGLTVSWYYRPEQTFHPANRTFWEGEVFKTSHFADHALEDIIEKIACQFTARHIRGRPRPPFWYLGFPLYVCDSRYNDRDRVFVKIKNWNSCVPEEVRKSTEFMPIYPFERTVFPRRLPSPFIGRGGVKASATTKGPGGIVSIEPADQQEDDNHADNVTEGRRRTRRNVGGDSGTKGYAGVGAQGTNAATVSPQIHYQPSNLSQQPQAPHQRLAAPDRSVITAAGGMSALGQGAHIEKLPAETAKHFDRDPETNEILWFPAPPVDIVKPSKPKYSLAYLHFLATKRKKETSDLDTNDHGPMSTPKRNRLDLPSTVTETLRSVLRDESLWTS